MRSFTELQVWQRGHRMVLSVYRLTDGFPAEERFGLVSQLRRAAASVPTNIAEGSTRGSSRDYARLLNVAEGSLAETQYLVMLSRDLGYAPASVAAPLLSELNEIARMLNALRTRVHPRPRPGTAAQTSRDA